jgi:hypothetical protein
MLDVIRVVKHQATNNIIDGLSLTARHLVHGEVLSIYQEMYIGKRILIFG